MFHNRNKQSHASVISRLRPPPFVWLKVWLFGPDSGLTPVILVQIKVQKSRPNKVDEKGPSMCRQAHLLLNWGLHQLTLSSILLVHDSNYIVKWLYQNIPSKQTKVNQACFSTRYKDILFTFKWNDRVKDRVKYVTMHIIYSYEHWNRWICMWSYRGM